LIDNKSPVHRESSWVVSTDRSPRVQDQLNAAAGLIRSYGAVAVLGAGISASRFPTTAHLPSLVWHAIDSSPDARSRLAHDLGKAGDTAKELIGYDPAALEAGWRVVDADPTARRAFQEAFARLDADRDPTRAHYAVARLIHAGLVEYVICFNWDTALERAYEQLFGTTIPPGGEVLAKPHGDAARRQDDWTLPSQPGLVPQRVLDRIAVLGRQRPRVLLLVGYSRSDDTVIETLLAPVESRWPVVRVGPTAIGDEAVTGFADDVLPALADALDAPVDMVDWRWVTFSRSRDLRAALLGYRLGPQDVDSCPSLAAVPRVAERLRLTGFAVVVGDSGAGKSITAFQAAKLLNQHGWGVVELSQPGVASADSVRAFQALRGPVVSVVDDAQALTPDVLRAFERAASADHAVIVVATERAAGEERGALAAGQEQVRVAAEQAVAALVDYCDRHREDVEPLLTQIDDRVGYGIGKESFGRRLEVARGSHYPWQFMYVLSGGERRIGGALADLADTGEADLLFGILAASQLLTLDAGISRETLVQYAHAIGRDDEWVANAITRLAEHRLVLERESRLRTPHLRIADRGLLTLCRNPANPTWRDLVGFLRTRLVDAGEPLQGKLWMLRAIDQSDPLRYGHRDLILDPGAARFLVDTCLAAPAGPERNIAAHLLWEVNWWGALDQSLAEMVAATLPKWILEITSDDVYGVRWLLGGLRSSFRELHGNVSARVAPEDVARRLLEHGSPREGEGWGNLLAELANAERTDPRAWADRFRDTVDAGRLAVWARSNAGESSLYGDIELVQDLAGLAPELAAVVVEAMAPMLIDLLERDVARASRLLVPWAFGVFPLIGAAEQPSRDGGEDHNRMLRDAVMALMADTDWTKVGAALTRAELHELDQIGLLTWSIHHVAPDSLARMTASVAFDDLDRIANGHWGDLAAIEELVIGLGHGVDHEPARSWVHRHQHEIHEMPTRVVPIAPDVAVHVLANGGRIVLQVQGGLRWGWCAEALDAILEEDRTAAIAVVQLSRDLIVEGLALLQANMTEDLREFVAVLDATDPTLLAELLEDLDIEVARKSWPGRLGGSEEEAEAVNLLLDRVLDRTSEIALLARQLRGVGPGPHVTAEAASEDTH
jgi:hypothetical protein